MARVHNKKGRNYEWQAKEYTRLFNKHTNTQLDRASLFFVGELKASMQGSGVAGGIFGATKSARAKASAGRTGQPPNVQTGRLKNSITFARRGKLRRGIGAGVGGLGEGSQERGYGWMLEFRRGKGWRPWLRPGLNKNLEGIKKIVTVPFVGPPSLLKGARKFGRI